MTKVVATHRDKSKDPSTFIKYFQDLLVDRIPLETDIEAQHYAGLGEMAAELQRWQVPTCPINGGHLKKVADKAWSSVWKNLEGTNGKVEGELLHPLTDSQRRNYFKQH